MKFEYLKGSEKHFEDAPEWARFRTILYGDSFFVEEHKEGALAFHIKNKVKARAGTEFNNQSRLTIIAERRPIAEPIVWLNLDECDGSEYLGPVVGKEMECHAKDGSIFAVVVVAFDGDLPIVKNKLHGNYFGCDPSQLKPIRSPEDVARDEAIAAFHDSGVMNLIHARQIYDVIAAGKIPGVKLEVRNGN
ncbi:hypothetical protein [Ewingella americana]